MYNKVLSTCSLSLNLQNPKTENRKLPTTFPKYTMRKVHTHSHTLTHTHTSPFIPFWTWANIFMLDLGGSNLNYPATESLLTPRTTSNSTFFLSPKDLSREISGKPIFSSTHTHTQFSPLEFARKCSSKWQRLKHKNSIRKKFICNFHFFSILFNSICIRK
jgi:hypothetical protein